MRSLVNAFAILAAVFVTLGLVGPVVFAQEPPEAIELAPGVSLEVVAVGAAEALPPTPATLAIYRARFEPGSSFAVAGDDPDTGVFVVESGTLTFNSTVPVVVVRSGFTAEEEVAAGIDGTLGPGDSFLSPPNSGGEFRNDGQEPVMLLIAAVEVVPAELAPKGTPVS